MKIKTSGNLGIRGKETPPDKNRARRKASSNQGARSSMRNRIAAAFRFLAKASVPVLLAIFVFLSGIFALSSDTFNLRGVSVSGCRYQDAKILEDIIRREFPANVLRMDLDKARRRLEKETWVRRVEIRRVLPSYLVLRVEERAPVVLLELNGVQMVADDEGVLLGAYTREFGKINSPIFRGLEGEDPEIYEMYHEENARRIQRGIAMLTEIVAGMPAAARSISEVDLSERNNMKILMDNDAAEISLGGENYLKRLAGFIGDPAKKYQEMKNQGIQVAQIDLSNDGQIVYKSSEAVAREKAMKNRRPLNR